MKCPVFETIRGNNTKIKLLIVDDKTDNIEVAASILAPDGFTLLYAESGVECLSIAESEQPDIILLDIMMPEMDGIETCKRLKANVATMHIAVIFLTAKIDDETLQQGFAAGGYDYISKPFSPTVLLSRVYNQLRIIYKQEALTRAQERLAKAEKNQLLGLLAGGIAHDFNNQLNGIMGFADLIKDRTIDAGIMSLADLITECGERCAILISNLLAFAGKGKYQVSRINILEIIQAAKNNVLEKYPYIEVIVNIAVVEPIIVGDYSQIESVVNTVVMNAVEAMSKQEHGELIFDIASSADTEIESGFKLNKLKGSGYVQIRVSDNGVGIPQENIDRVFEPFFTTKDLSLGGGMSLAAAYGIVENHGGEINIRSSEGEGTVVTILLPVEAGPVDYSDTGEGLAGSMDEDYDYILVIDDNKMSRILLEDIIPAQSYRVLTASNGMQGLELFARFKSKIRLVFLDYIMPQMSGDEVLKRIMELDPDAVVYIVSGYKSEQSIADLLALGAKGFIKKPFKCRDIIEVI